MKKLFLILLLLRCYTISFAQNTGINNDGSAPNSSAMLDIKSGTKGILIPRTSSTSRTAIVNPAKGLLLYDTTIGSFWFHNGGMWVEAGRVDATNSNAFFGYQSGFNIPVGDFNCGIGTQALYANNTGSNNTSLGVSSMHNNTSGNNNTVAGIQTLYFNTVGSDNTAVGANALLLNQTGYSNVAVGSGALFHNVNAHNIIAIGDSSLFHSDDNASVSNTAVGSKTLFTNSSGYQNTAIGFQSLYSSTVGIGNTAVGHLALYSNISGGSNVAIGVDAMRTNTTTFSNVAIGYGSLKFNTGNNNTAIGMLSLANNGGGENVGIGSNTIIEGSSGTALGINATVQGNIQTSTALGAFSTVSCSQCMALGGSDATSRTKVGINIAAPFTDLHIIQQSDNGLDKTRGIRLQRANGNQWRTLIDPSNNYIFEYNNNLYSYIEPVGGAFVNPSDERLKKDILPLDDALNNVLQLQPKTYHYISSTDTDRRLYGFLAQDVEKIFPEFVFTSETGYKGIAYSNFSVIAIKAIQQQQAIIADLRDQNQQLKQQLQQQTEALLKRIEVLEKKSL